MNKLLNETLSGNISPAALANLLNYLKMTEAEGRLVLKKDGEIGQIYLEEGLISHCIWHDKIGPLALTEILSWQEGVFEYEPDVFSPLQSIEDAS